MCKYLAMILVLKELRKDVLFSPSHYSLTISKGVLVQMDNSPVHKFVIVIAAIIDNCFELFEYPPNLHDLALSGFHLYPNVKKKSGTHFWSDDDVIQRSRKGHL